MLCGNSNDRQAKVGVWDPLPFACHSQEESI